jgi:hypothetical protein
LDSSFQHLSKFWMSRNYNPESLLLGICPKEMTWRSTGPVKVSTTERLAWAFPYLIFKQSTLWGWEHWAHSRDEANES